MGVVVKPKPPLSIHVDQFPAVADKIRRGLPVDDEPQGTPAKATHRFVGLSKGQIAERGIMNATEAQYAAELDLRIQAGEVADYWFEIGTLRLSHPPEGQPARITVDFMVLMPDGETHMVDVKGGQVNDASIVAMKCAAEQYPLWRFFIAQKQAKKDGGGFKLSEL